MERSPMADMMKVEHLTDSDIAILKKIWPIIEKDKVVIVDAFYNHLSQFEETQNLIRIIEQKVKEQKIKGDLKYLLGLWVVGMFSGHYDKAYEDGIRNTLGKYIKAGIPMRVMLSALGYLRSLLTYYLCKEIGQGHENINKTTNMILALGKIIDLNLLITCDVYMANTNKLIFKSRF